MHHTPGPSFAIHGDPSKLATLLTRLMLRPNSATWRGYGPAELMVVGASFVGGHGTLRTVRLMPGDDELSAFDTTTGEVRSFTIYERADYRAEHIGGQIVPFVADPMLTA